MNIASLLRGFATDRSLATFELDIAFDGTGSGSVTRNPPNLVSKRDCAGIYTSGLMVNLFASPDENSVFIGWSEDAQGTEPACSIVMNAAKKVVAKFSLITEQEKRINPFVDNCDGTVTDSRTGLMWMRFATGQDWSNGHCVGYANKFTFDQAKVISSDFAGYNDWRLPTIDELQSIIEKLRSNPAFDRAAFPGFEKVSPLFWTSSIDSDAYTGQVEPWYVSFYSGTSYRGDPRSSNSVRLVRNAELSHKTLNKSGDLAVIAGQRIAFENATEWSGSGFEYLLRDIESTDRPSATLMKVLVNNPGIVSRSIGRLNRTLLHHAAALHKLDTVKYLCLRCRAEINAMDRDGETPLDYALAVNAVQVVEYLRTNGGRSRKSVIETKPNSELSIQERGNALIQIETRQINGEQQSTVQNPVKVLRFTDNGDGTVLDTETGLTWMRFSEGQTRSDGTFDPRLMTMYEASALHKLKQFAGFNDWRLPSLEELKTLVEIDHENIAIDSDVFPLTPASNYWSCSVDHGDWLWGVNFLDGKILAHKPSNRNYVRLVRRGFALTVNTEGFGEGVVTRSSDQKNYAFGTTIEVKAIAKPGSVFSRWTGDITSHSSTCYLLINEDKHLVAHFEKKSFVLCIKQIGTGFGIVDCSSEPSIEAVSNPQLCPAGASVILTAIPAQDSFFAGWSGSASGTEASLTVLMDAEKSVVANFQLKTFALRLSQDGSGSGDVACIPEGSPYPIGTLVTVAANPNPGSVFSGWTGDLTESEPTCRVVMDSAKAMNANFSRLSFSLDVLTAGSGVGSISRNPALESYYYGDTVTLTAQAANGAVFSGWRGGATGVDATLTISLDEDKTLIAGFKRLNIPELEIAANFLTAEHGNMKSGDDAFIIYLSIANKGQKQFRIELPLVSYVTHDGEEIQQDAWLTGLVIGSEGATVRSGTFRKAGLIFFKSKLRQISAGDQFHVSIAQSLPARRFDFSFRCTDSKSRAFTLISAAVEEVHVPLEMPVSAFDSSEILQRLELLEAGLSDVLCRLKSLETAPSELIKNAENIVSTVASLAQVLAWLMTQERVSLAALRSQLLPLDQFPGAFIDELNERALDLTGDIALEESGEEIIITKEVLLEVIANLE